ncbi:MAG: hypothetical protein JWQ57_3251, partial [Mucilaginibacter sp.]|nr:hypothetical protein [Mucilaginibacter sp.]
SFSFPGVSSAQLASWGFTPINIALSDIRPMVRAELKKIDTGLPKGGDAITAAHYADLHLRIKEALNPTRPIVNIGGGMGRGINNAGQDILNEKTGSMNCWPRTNVEN